MWRTQQSCGKIMSVALPLGEQTYETEGLRGGASGCEFRGGKNALQWKTSLIRVKFLASARNRSVLELNPDWELLGFVPRGTLAILTQDSELFHVEHGGVHSSRLPKFS
jgi:hypothetical protein